MTALVGLEASVALCGDRLDLVDGSYAGKAGAAKELREELCPVCPIQVRCFESGMAEPRLPMGGGGVWGGTSSNQRTRAINRRIHRAKEPA